MQHPFFLQDNTFCLTLSVGYSPRVPPETKRGRIEKNENESEQPAGKVHFNATMKLVVREMIMTIISKEFFHFFVMALTS